MQAKAVGVLLVLVAVAATMRGVHGRVLTKEYEDQLLERERARFMRELPDSQRKADRPDVSFTVKTIANALKFALGSAETEPSSNTANTPKAAQATQATLVADNALVPAPPLVATSVGNGTTTGAPRPPPPNVPPQKKRCVLLHGLWNPDEGPPTDSLPRVFGDVQRVMHQCSEVLFLHEDTYNQAWFDERLYTRVCSWLTNGDPNNVVRNTIIFSFSVGSLVIGAGLEAGACSLDRATTSWNLVGYFPPAPSRGPGDTLVELFSKSVNGTNVLDTVWQSPVVSAMMDMFTDNMQMHGNWMHCRAVFCIVGSSKCENAMPMERQLRVEAVVKENVDGAICGSSLRNVGDLGSPDYDEIFTSFLTPRMSDCTVLTDKCISVRRDGAFFGDHFSDAYYLSSVNHLALTCARGDGDTDDRKPCQWFASRT